MKFKILVEYEYPVEHKLPIKAELILHGDRVVTDNIKPLEQEPKSEWEHDHEILKAYSDGASEVLDKIRFDLYKLYNDRPSDYNHSQRTELFCEVIKILDKYTAESAHDVAQEIVKNNGVVEL